MQKPAASAALYGCSGKARTPLAFFIVKANIIVIGPILPRYIVRIIIDFPIRFMLPVKLRDKPTVASAEVDSYMISRDLPGTKMSKHVVVITSTLKLTIMTANAFFR